MADSTTGGLPVIKVDALPPAHEVYDEFIMPGEFQGSAVKITGRQIKNYASAGSKRYSEEAQKSSDEAERSADEAKKSAKDAELSKIYIENMTVTAKTLLQSEYATAEKTKTQDSFNIELGIPKGEKGDPGTSDKIGKVTASVNSNVGTPEVYVSDLIESGSNSHSIHFTFKNLKGDSGDQLFKFAVEDGHLIVYYTSLNDAMFELDRSDGHLYININ